MISALQVGPARADDDQPYLDDIEVTLGRVVRDGGGADVNVTVKSAAPVRLRFVSLGCSALSKSGEALDTAPITLENVPPGRAVQGTAFFSAVPRDATFDCRVESYDE